MVLHQSADSNFCNSQQVADQSFASKVGGPNCTKPNAPWCCTSDGQLACAAAETKNDINPCCSDITGAPSGTISLPPTTRIACQSQISMLSSYEPKAYNSDCRAAESGTAEAPLSANISIACSGGSSLDVDCLRLFSLSLLQSSPS